MSAAGPVDSHIAVYKQRIAEAEAAAAAAAAAAAPAAAEARAN